MNDTQQKEFDDDRGLLGSLSELRAAEFTTEFAEITSFLLEIEVTLA